MRNTLTHYWQELGDVIEMMPIGPMERAAKLLFECYQRGGTVFVLGNGGSAATASHFACDLAKGTRIGVGDLPAFRVVALTDNVPLITAWANDTSYERVFAEQLAALVRPGDIVVAISASGNSANVLTATEVARRMGALTIALTDQTGGKLRRLANLTIRVPALASERIEQVEDAHLVISHSLCVALRGRLRLLSAERSALEHAALAPDPVAGLFLAEPALDTSAAG